MRVPGKTAQRFWVLGVALGLIFLSSGAATSALARPPQDEDWKAPEAAKKVKNPVPVTPASLAAGKAVYTDNCERCHGEAGKGDGSDADLYDPGPADLSDVKLMQGMTDGELFYKITEGRRPMPSFKKDLNDEKRWQAVIYLRTFSKPTR